MADSASHQPQHRSTADGERAAAREHARLKTAHGLPVDIFDVIERSGIWLMFQPLANLYGAYERVGEAAGIMINAKQPLSLQRFTAAHEYGHHVLGHATSLDDEAHILPDGPALTPRESAAQTFAAHFLMPTPLVDAALERHGLPPKPGRLTPREAYRISLDLGVSYAAAVNHLAALGKLDHECAVELRRKAPKRIKAEIAGRDRPRNDRSDTWLLHEGDSGGVLHPRLNDELYAELSEVPSSGYIWSVSEEDVADLRAGSATRGALGDAPLALVDDDFQVAPEGETGRRYGTGCRRRLVFKVLRPGRHRLQLVKRRPWLDGAQPAGRWEVDLDVSPPQTGVVNRGLSERQKPLLVATAP